MVMGDMVMKVDVVVIGAGPAGYCAAFRAAELGLDVTLLDARDKIGGSYLYDTCIPSKLYLTQAKLLIETGKAKEMGIHFPKAHIDLSQMNSWRDHIQSKITSNLHSLCEQHGVQLIQGKASFDGSNTIRLKDAELSKLKYNYAVIATGASPSTFSGISFEQSNRVLSPAKALHIKEIPEKLLIVGGGCTGIEIGSIYAAFGTTVDLAEQNSHILVNADADLTAPLIEQLSSQFKRLMLQSKVAEIIERDGHVTVKMKTPRGDESHNYDKVVVAIGQQAHTAELGLENTLVELDSYGFIKTDTQQRTGEPSIFAVGDVANKTMLAHTAIRQGQIAAEVVAGLSSAFDIRAIPIIVYTYPQIAWCGLTEAKAHKNNIPVTIKKYHWNHATRAITLDKPYGLTKVIISKEDNRILGTGITGAGAEDLISEWVLAIEMGARMEDMELILHGHPTLSEVL